MQNCFLTNITYAPKWETKIHNSLFNLKELKKAAPDRATKSKMGARMGNKVTKHSISDILNF